MRVPFAFLRRRSPWKGLLAGVAGGLAGSFAMNQFQAGITKVSEKISQTEMRSGPQAVKPHEQGDQQASRDASEDSTVKMAQLIARKVLHRDLSGPEKKKAGPVVHYAFGAMAGGLYGALVEEAPVVKAGFGLAYGSAVWAVGDELAVPLLGLSKPPQEYSWKVHAMALASHLVFGAGLEGARRLLRTKAL